MNNQVTITAAIQSASIEQMLLAYKSYSGNASATSDEFFEFLTLPTAEREAFYSINVLVIIRYRDLLLYLTTK